MECMEDLGEARENLRPFVTELIILVENEEDPERREILNQRKERQQEKWMRVIGYQKVYEEQREEVKKHTLKCLDKEDHQKFLEWVNLN